MIAQRERIDAKVKQAFTDLLGDAEPGRRVLGIDDDEVEGEGLAQIGQMRFQRPASGLADNITEKSKTHARLQARSARRTGQGAGYDAYRA